MIERVRGQVLEQRENELILQMGPVDLRLFFSPKQGEFVIGSTIELYTYLLVKEEAFALFGFQKREELELFRRLLTVSGVGPKLAQSLIAHLSLEELSEAILRNNPSSLLRIPGIGKKTATRILFAMQGKLLAQDEFAAPSLLWAESLQALISLGFSEAEARERLRKVNLQDSSMTTVEIVKEALRQ